MTFFLFLALFGCLALFEFILFCLNACKNETVDDKMSITEADSSTIDEPKQFFFRNDTFSVVRIENQRVFVVIDSSAVKNMNLIKPIIARVKENYPFERLGISFFTDSIHAGYKTEFMNDSVEIKKWAHAYVSEYDLLTKEYWTRALQPELKRKYIIE